MIIRLDINRSTPGLVFSGVMPTSVAKFILCEKESEVLCQQEFEDLLFLDG
jgi:hypothetical protein